MWMASEGYQECLLYAPWEVCKVRIPRGIPAGQLLDFRMKVSIQTNDAQSFMLKVLIFSSSHSLLHHLSIWRYCRTEPHI